MDVTLESVDAEPLDPRLEALIDSPETITDPSDFEIAASTLIQAARREAPGDAPAPSLELQSAFAAASRGGRRPTHLRQARLGTAAILGAAAVVFLGGVAAAAGLGELPGSIQRVAHSLLGAPASPSEHQVAASASESSEATESASPSDTSTDPSDPSTSGSSSGSDSASASSTATPGAQSAQGLCRAWTVQQGAVNPKSALHVRLTQLAGSMSIADYCARVLGTPAITPSSWPRALPTPATTHIKPVVPAPTHPVHPSPTPHSAA